MHITHENFYDIYPLTDITDVHRSNLRMRRVSCVMAAGRMAAWHVAVERHAI